MATPIIMLVLLVVPGVLGRLMGKAGWWAYGPACVFAFTGVGHFIATEAMVEMLPPWMPWRRAGVLASGVFELGLAAALAWSVTRQKAAWIAALFLVAVAPLNVYAAWNGVGPGGHTWGPIYLWIRLPLQLLLIVACYTVATRSGRSLAAS